MSMLFAVVNVCVRFRNLNGLGLTCLEQLPPGMSRGYPMTRSWDRTKQGPSPEYVPKNCIKPYEFT